MTVFDVKEVATYLNCSESAIRKLVNNKEIPCYRVGSRILFRENAIEDWINKQEINNTKNANKGDYVWQLKN